MSQASRLTPDGRTFAAYMAVRHLPNDAAALRLGKSRRTVAEYRRNNPATAYDPNANRPPQTNLGTIAYMVPMTEPNKTVNGSSTRWMRVTLPAPPPGPHCAPFERQGVRG